MAMTYNSEGHLILDIARGKYRLYSFLLLIAAYYFHAISPTPEGEDFNIVTIICILWAITLLWRSFFSQPLIFDTHQKCIFRGRHLVTRFSDIEYVEQRREKTRVGIFYWMRLHLKRSRKLALGYQDSNVAMTIANVIEKPVHGGDSWL
jgi:hypothetical protein